MKKKSLKLLFCLSVTAMMLGNIHVVCNIAPANQYFSDRIEYLEHEVKRLNGLIEDLMRNKKDPSPDTDSRKYKKIKIKHLDGAFNYGDDDITKKRTKLSHISQDNDANEDLIAKENAEKLDEDEIIARFESAKSLLQSMNYDLAQNAFIRFTREFGNHYLAVLAYYWLGEISYAIKSDFHNAVIYYSNAKNHYESLTNGRNQKVPRHIVQEILLKLTTSLRNIGKLDEAKNLIMTMRTRYNPLPAVIADKLNSLEIQINLLEKKQNIAKDKESKRKQILVNNDDINDVIDNNY